MSGYKHVPSSEAQSMAHAFNKTLVAIVTCDSVHDRTGITTFGKTADDKILAAMTADKFASLLKLGVGNKHEDFRDDPACVPARYAEAKLLITRALSDRIDDEWLKQAKKWMEGA